MGGSHLSRTCGNAPGSCHQKQANQLVVIRVKYGVSDTHRYRGQKRSRQQVVDVDLSRVEPRITPSLLPVHRQWRRFFAWGVKTLNRKGFNG